MIKRALMIKKEWINRIFDDGKIWEMRSTKTNIRERVGLIEVGSGLIMGEADLIGCGQRLTEQTAADNLKFHQVDDLSKLKYWCYPWILENVIRYEKPIPYNHPSGAIIWVTVSEDIMKKQQVIKELLDLSTDNSEFAVNEFDNITAEMKCTDPETIEYLIANGLKVNNTKNRIK